MKKRVIYLMLILFGVAMFSCKKDDAGSLKDKLIGKWMMVAMTSSPAFEGETDLFILKDSCSKDDIVIFNADGTVTNDEGVLKCDEEDPQTSSGGTWTLSSDNKTLQVTKNGTVANITIITLTSSEFVGTRQQILNGVTYTYTMTFVRE